MRMINFLTGYRTVWTTPWTWGHDGRCVALSGLFSVPFRRAGRCSAIRAPGSLLVVNTDQLAAGTRCGSRRIRLIKVERVTTRFVMSTRYSCTWYIKVENSGFVLPSTLGSPVSSFAMPLALPWEVIERAVDHSVDDASALFNLSLTCRQLRPRSLCHIFGHFDLRSRDDVFALCDFLLGRPHLRPFIRSIAIRPTHFLPYPLLHVLSNLIACTFFTEDAEPPKTTFHTSTLSCCRLTANGVRSLSIHNLAFPTLLSFSRIISAFKKLEVLACSRVEIKKDVVLHPGQLERLSKHLQLRKLSVEWGVDASVAALLLKLAKPTLESLVLAPTIGTANPYAQLRATSEASSWARVKCLVIKTTLQTKDVVLAVKLLKAFHPASLRAVTVSFHSTSYGDYISILADEAHWELCLELERVLRRFPAHTMLFSADEPPAQTPSAFIGTRSWTTPPQVNRAVHVNRPSEPSRSRLEASGCDHLY